MTTPPRGPIELVWRKLHAEFAASGKVTWTELQIMRLMFFKGAKTAYEALHKAGPLPMVTAAMIDIELYNFDFEVEHMSYTLKQRPKLSVIEGDANGNRKATTIEIRTRGRGPERKAAPAAEPDIPRSTVPEGQDAS